MDYAFKIARPGAEFVPATEWLCSHLSNACRIQTPPMDILHTPDGDVCFGSRIEGGKLDEDMCLLELMAGEMASKVPNLRARLSMIYALDLFTNNTDRHLNNFLFRSSLQHVVIMAFDFSLAWLAHGPQLQGYPGESSKTRLVRPILDRMYGFDAVSARAVIETIRSLPDDWIDGPVNSMPDEWKVGVDVNAAVEWWKSDKRDERCAFLIGAIK